MDMAQQFNVLVLQDALTVDKNPSEPPLTNKMTNSPDEVKKMFGPITYKKGASVIKMTRDFLGEDTFRRALGHYVYEM